MWPIPFLASLLLLPLLPMIDTDTDTNTDIFGQGKRLYPFLVSNIIPDQKGKGKNPGIGFLE